MSDLSLIQMGAVFAFSGIMEGNILLINGEGIFGAALGVLFVVWMTRHFSSTNAG